MLAAIERQRLLVPVRDVMLPFDKLPTASPEERLVDFVLRMNTMHFGYGFAVENSPHGPICRGIFTERDLMSDRVMYKISDLADTNPRLIAPFLEKPIREFMTHNPESVNKDDRMVYAMRRMARAEFRRVPVTREVAGEEILEGAISARTIANFDWRLLKHERAAHNRAGNRDDELRLECPEVEQVFGVAAESIVFSAEQLAALTRYRLETPVKKVMICTPQVPWAEPGTHIIDLIRRMNRLNFGYAFVCEETEHGPNCLGIITERDLMGPRFFNELVTLAQTSPAGVPGLLARGVEHFMSPNPTGVAADTPMETALDLMCRGQFRRLPVFRDVGGSMILIGALSARTLVNDDIDTLQRLILGGPDKPQKWNWVGGR